MIYREEIEEKASEFDIHPTNVERDYVFGWLLSGIYNASTLKDILVLKGGNAFRKGYFPTTRFSSDLDFSTQRRIDPQSLQSELNKVCDFVHEYSGVQFEKERNLVKEKKHSDKNLSVYEARIYFKDFYGKPGIVTIKVKLDITEFEKIYLPTQKRLLIHPYSDADDCKAEIECMKLEEMLAAKLKCLLQRRHSFDLFDLVYAIFVNKELDVNKPEIVSVFLRKTIFSRSPGVARNLLLGLPLDLFKGYWERHLVCPKESRFPFENALEWFGTFIKEILGEEIGSFAERFFYPAEMRNLILEAGNNNQLIELTYSGRKRIVEPYSLTYKRRKDGHAEEYFYVWDRSSGGSGPGIKTFLNTKVDDLILLDEKFDPKFPVELSKAGEHPKAGYFSKPGFSGGNTKKPKGHQSTSAYTVECPYCGKRFKRSKYNTRLNKHKDKSGNQCYGRNGFMV